MGLLSFFKRGTDTPARPPIAEEPGGDVQRARTRARQRLIGAVVLVAIGVIGFPLVFETQPRPISVDIPIDIPRKEGAPPLVMPAARPVRATPDPVAAPASNNAVDAAAAAPSPRDEVITETREEAGRVAPAATRIATEAAASKAASRPPEAAQPVAKPAVEPKPAAKPKPAAARPAAGEDDARARALLEGKPAPPAAESSRFVVQVGAFADAGAARDTRAKAERLGLKTYTQVVETSAGTRIRVRIGPFTTRTEADKALASARSAGLTAALLTL